MNALEVMMMSRASQEQRVPKKNTGGGRKKKKDGGPVVRNMNIGAVMRLWQDREKTQAVGTDRKTRTRVHEQVGVAPVVGVNGDDDDVIIVENDDVEVDRTSVVVDDVDMTRQSTEVNVDSVVRVEPRNFTDNDKNKIYTDLSRKRKMSPAPVQDTSGKRGRTTPLLGRLENRSELSQNSNSLITHHFTFSSLASSRGDGQAVHAAVGRAGGGGGVGGAVQGTRARTESGLAGEGRIGITRRVLTKNTIGPDQTADRTSANPGCSTVQLMMSKFQRGNVHAT